MTGESRVSQFDAVSREISLNVFKVLCTVGGYHVCFAIGFSFVRHADNCAMMSILWSHNPCICCSVNADCIGAWLLFVFPITDLAVLPAVSAASCIWIL